MSCKKGKKEDTNTNNVYVLQPINHFSGNTLDSDRGYSLVRIQFISVMTSWFTANITIHRISNIAINYINRFNRKH